MFESIDEKSALEEINNFKVVVGNRTHYRVEEYTTREEVRSCVGCVLFLHSIPFFYDIAAYFLEPSCDITK